MQHIKGKTITLSEKQRKQLKLNENDNFASPDYVDYKVDILPRLKRVGFLDDLS